MLIKEWNVKSNLQIIMANRDAILGGDRASGLRYRDGISLSTCYPKLGLSISMLELCIVIAFSRLLGYSNMDGHFGNVSDL
jgi:hypothetical protein